jgi:membrane associated rhomboid family serine protease
MMLAIFTFAVQMYCDPKQQYLNGLILERLSFSGVLGYMWLHMSGTHIVGNLITLWIFGRYVSLKIGNANFFLSYVCLGIAAAAVHFLFDGRPTIGASGAIMGILGMHLVLCYRRLGILGPWLILAWFILNLIAGIIGGYPTTYMAHVGGFLGGLILGNVLIFLNIVEYDDAHQTLVRILRFSIFTNRHRRKPLSLKRKTVIIPRAQTETSACVSLDADAINKGSKPIITVAGPTKPKIPICNHK